MKKCGTLGTGDRPRRVARPRRTARAAYACVDARRRSPGGRRDHHMPRNTPERPTGSPAGAGSLITKWPPCCEAGRQGPYYREPHLRGEQGPRYPRTVPGQIVPPHGDERQAFSLTQAVTRMGHPGSPSILRPRRRLLRAVHRRLRRPAFSREGGDPAERGERSSSMPARPWPPIDELLTHHRGCDTIATLADGISTVVAPHAGGEKRARHQAGAPGRRRRP